MTFIFPYIGNVIIPTDELIFFRGVETTNQFWIGSSMKIAESKETVYNVYLTNDELAMRL